MAGAGVLPVFMRIGGGETFRIGELDLCATGEATATLSRRRLAALLRAAAERIEADEAGAE